MSFAWDDLHGRPSEYDDPAWTGANRRERVAELLARSPLFQPEAGLTEQEQAERIVAGRERQRKHDAYFAADFISGAEAHQVSLSLCKKLGFSVGDPQVTGDMDRDERMPFGDQD